MITVLMPVFNSAKFISKAINSVLNQSFSNFELLVIDDGSTDATEDCIMKFHDSRIRFIKRKHEGISATLNYGLENAHNDLVARMDSDDIAHPKRLEKQLKYLENSSIDVLSCHYAIISNNKVNYVIKTPTDHSQIVSGLKLHSYISHPGCIYNRNTILRFGGYDEEVFEDYALWLKIQNEVKFGNIPECLIFQNYRKDSLSRLDLKDKAKKVYNIQSKYYCSIESNIKSKNQREDKIYRGWREYFYGDKDIARKIWNEIGLRILIYPKIILAYLLTFLNENTLTLIKEVRIKYRIKYIFMYYSSYNKEVRRVFNSINYLNSKYE